MNTDYLYKTYTFYSGPAHGWLEIPKTVINYLQVKPSAFSYYDSEKDLVYLEEDCDATKFTKAFKNTFPNCELKIGHKTIASEAFIRNLPRTM